MKFACFFTSFILYVLCGNAQQLQQVAHCPSNEVYDMLLDKKGFIWIAHNLGVSRYDGISFASFSNPEETSISMTDLVEDHYGRIWCHNFNGQIFYIKDDKMVYLKEYDFKKETIFPRMALYGDELIATSTRGLFICNTTTLACKYLPIPEKKQAWEFGTVALCIIKNTVLIIRDKYTFYTYKKGEGLHLLQTKNLNFSPLSTPNVKLLSRVFNDTAFITANPGSTLIGVTILKNTLVPVFKKIIKSNINTISINNNNVWINTNQESFSLFGKDTIKDYGITAMLNDNYKNEWFSSLTYGLLVSSKTSGWRNITPKDLRPMDFIKCIKSNGSRFILCSQQGAVLMGEGRKTDSFSLIYKLPPSFGSPENIQLAYPGYFFLDMSKGIFVLNAQSQKVILIDSLIGSHDVILNGQFAYIAAGTSLLLREIKDWGLPYDQATDPSFTISDTLLFNNPKQKIKVLRKQRRCRAVMFDSATNSLLASFTDGLQRIKDNRPIYVLYKGQPLYVSSMARFGNKIYAGTFNNGLFVIDGYEVRKVTNNSESPQNAIVRIKCCNNHIWVFRYDDIEVLDAATGKFVSIYPFPVDVADITDVEEDSSNIYLATHTGLFTIPTFAKEELVKANPSLLYVLVNDIDTLLQSGITLPANKNNLLFRLAIPVYKDADQLHFKYSLVSEGDTTSRTWYYTQDAKRDIQFNALKPGSYTIEITAMQDDREISNTHLIYNFTISKPWFNTWWFYTAVILFTVSVSIGLYQYRLYQHVKMERMRRKISNDLHDDIGSTLSSINVYSQLAKGNYGNEGYINTIQSSTVSIISNLDDLVWNINPKNDVLWQLVSRMQLFAETLLREKGIECIFKTKLLEKEFVVSPNARAHLYLLFKEIINNILKHSGSTQCSIYIIQKNKLLRLSVKDNGKGFNTKTTSQHRNGLRIMAERVKELKGSLTINSAPGEGTEIKIMCRLV